MIANIRGSIRLLLFFLISLLTVLLVASGNILLSIVSTRWANIWKNRVIYLWSWLMSRLLKMDIHIKGSVGDPPFYLVSNHLSYIDVIPLWLCAKGTFIAKSEIESWPFFGWATKTLGVIFIDRNTRRDVQRVNKLIASTISEEQGVMIFPEGTSTKGEEVKPFHTSLLQYPAETDMPVQYASISYKSYDSNRPASHYICWWGDMPFFGHFWKLLKMKGFEVTISFGDKAIGHHDRKVLASKLHHAVKEHFDPVVTGQHKSYQKESSKV